MNLQQEFKKYLEENFGLDKKEELIKNAFDEFDATINFSREFTITNNTSKSYDHGLRHDIDRSVFESILQDIPDIFIDEKSSNSDYEIAEKLVYEHIKIFNLDEYAKQHVERMV